MGAEIDRLEVQIESKATKVNNSLDTLVAKLDRVSSALTKLNSGGLSGLSDGVSKFAQASTQLSNVKTADFTRLAKNIEKLSNLNTKELYGASHAMRTLANSMNGFGNVSGNSVGVAQFASSISKLGGVNVQRAITNLPALSNAMNDLMTNLSRAPQVSNNVIQLTRALADLAAQGSKVGTAATGLNQSINTTGNVLSANTKKAKGFASAIGSIYQKYFWVIRVAKKLWESIENSMNYIETLNYFDAAFGQVAELAVSQMESAGEEAAQAYYDSFSAKAKELTSKMTGYIVNDNGTLTATGSASLGIDPNKLMNYQATFAQMSSSMGVASETSLKLSNALTMIGADLASVKNMDFDKVWTDMASGLAGMSRTLDKYGANIRNVNLQQKLLDLGIEENITNLNQNDKALLRAIILLDSTKYAWGDLAETINQPANQLRLLENNFSNLSRTVGNLFLPLVQKVLPYVNGLVISAQRLFTWLGALMGIDLSEITSAVGSSEVDLSELLGDTDDLADSLEDASAAAKKLQSNLQGFDELNVITTQTETDTSGLDTSLSSGLLDAAFDDALAEYQKAWNEAFANMENRANDFADKIDGYLEPVKNLIESFGIGDFFKAGQDTSNLVAGIFDYFSRAIDGVDWNEIGRDIGEFLEGIEWIEVMESVGDAAWEGLKAAIELWSGIFKESPIETLTITFGAFSFLLGKEKLTSALFGSVLGESLGLTVATGGKAFTYSLRATLTVMWTLKNLIKDEDSFLRKLMDKYAYNDEDREKYKEFNNFTWSDTIKKNIEEVKKGWSNLFNFGDTSKYPTFFEFYGEKLESFRKDFNQTMADTFGDWAGVTLPEAANAIGDWFKEDVSPWFTKEKWEALGENAKRGLTGKWTEFTVWWQNTGLYKWWNRDVVPFFSRDAWSWEGIKDGMVESWNRAIESIKNIWNTFANWLNDKMTWEIEPISIAGKQIFAGATISLGTIPTFSTGGFPEDGWFRASKGEYFGEFDDGTSYIANNEQIVAGIEYGVEQAVARILEPYLAEIARNTRETADKELVITNDTIGRSARRYAKEFHDRTGRPAYNF